MVSDAERRDARPYKEVHVDVAREIAHRCDKSIVIVLAYDPVYEVTHTTTYGKEPIDKQVAANLGEQVTAFVGADISRATHFEDFRTKTAADHAQEVDRLHARIRELEQTLSEVRAPGWGQ